ncbi:MAG: enoyl-CoA hydratase/isomerase family protein [Candidatus Rokubacteria bacterium]|nr:enoyl-CoA hydratase/isomerase family protein [Candidatus Rokubacteria bacterium]
MADPNVLFDVQAGVARITLNRPDVLNAVDVALAAQLADAVEAAARNPNIWVVVVRGAGSSFSSGIDRNALAAGEIGEAFYRHWIRGLNGLEDMGKLVIAVLHGYCLGGGLQLALACDLRLATRDCVLALGATAHGLVPDGAVLRLARVVGIGRAKELALLNPRITPEEARAIGLVNWVVGSDEVEGALARITESALHAAPTAVWHTKRLLHASFHSDPRALVEELILAQKECMRSWEIEVANRAWHEKREARYYPPPDGTGRPDAG